MKARSGVKGARILTGLLGGLIAGVGWAALAARRENMSLPLFATRTVLSFAPNVFKDPERLRQQLQERPYPQDAPLPASLRRLCAVTEWKAEGQTVITLVPRKGRTKWHVLYLHGGAYVFPLVRAHWNSIRAIIDATGASVTVPLYALAPENDYRPATAAVDLVYERLLREKGEGRIAVAGDSAGGNFALALAVRRRDAGLPLPERLILLSPWLDLTLRDEAAREVEARDVMLAVDGVRECGRMWAGPLDPRSPHLSPLYADLAGLPSTAYFQGSHDILVVDARSFASKAEAAGMDLRYLEYPGAFHVFMGATFTPEAHDVFRHVAAFLDD